MQRFTIFLLTLVFTGCVSAPKGDSSKIASSGLKTSVFKDANGTHTHLDDLVVSVMEGNRQKVAALLKSGYPVAGKSKPANEPAYWAIFQNNAAILQVLIDYGLDVNFDWGFDGGNLLTNAVQFGRKDAVDILLKNGATTKRDTKYGRTPLYAAIIYSQVEIEKLLAQKGAKLNSWDIAALRQLGIAFNPEYTEQNGAENSTAPLH